MDTIKQIESKIRKKYSNENTGHDIYHILRVRYLSMTLCEQRDDINYVTILALLHEELDDKLNAEDAMNRLSLLLEEVNISTDQQQRLIDDIQSIGYKGGFVKSDQSREAVIVSDADRLEAMGAIGIARTFQYNGSVKHQPLFDPELEDVVVENIEDYRQLKRNAIAHFDEKLLKLKDLMVTTKGKELANKRHQVMLDYLESFYYEMQQANFVSKKYKNHV